MIRVGRTNPRPAGLAVLALAAVAPGVARAAGGGTAGVGWTALLTLLVGGAFALAHFAVERLQQRTLALAGVEYLVLGVVLGPALAAEGGPLAEGGTGGPLVAFTVGWIGLLCGLQLEPPGRAGGPRAGLLAALDAALSGGAVGAASWAALGLTAQLGLGPVRPADGVVLAAGLGIAAAAPSGAAAAMLGVRYPRYSGRVLPFLRHFAAAGEPIAVIALGVVFALFPPGGVPGEAAAARAGLTVGLGLVLAALFALFLGRDRSENQVFLASTGTLLFASGAAFFLHLSALAVNLVLGVALGRTSVGPGIAAGLERTAGPTRLLLLVLAGTLWRPVPLALAVLAPAAFLAVRTIAKILAGFLGTLGSSHRADLWRGLWAQGNVAFAVAVSMRLGWEGPLYDLAYHTILVAVVVSELTAPRLLRSVLVDAGELDEDLGPDARREPA